LTLRINPNGSEAQIRGIAARLIGEFLEQADDARVPVALSVLKGNPAINLYRRMGFQVVNTTDTSWPMRRQCAAAGHER
jgi:ribosomal protein S18 acetylase RimI-like enzyme